MFELNGQTVAILGASAGIGLAAARAAAAQGARVVMMSRSKQRLDQAAAAIGGNAQAVSLDMLDRGAVERIMASIISIDHLVLSAVGDEYALFARLEHLTDEQVERSFDKLRGWVNVTRAAVPLMRGRGSITLLSGAGAVKPPAETSLAAAANGSIVSFGRALALELAPVRVNVLMPGVVDTNRHGNQWGRLKTFAESSLPARRFGQPEDIAQAIVFLMANPYVTGHTLVVDGGYLAA